MNDQTWITLAGIGALFAFAVWIRPSDPTIVGAFIAAIAGLAGYHLSKRASAPNSGNTPA